MFAIGPAAFALMSALSYGAGDFLGGRASTRLPTLTVLLIAQVAACTVAVLAAGGVSLSAVDQSSRLLGLVGGVAHVAAVGLLYHGLAHGRICVIAPVSGIVNIALPVLVDGVAINGLSLVQSLGILMAASAVGLVSCCGGYGLGQLVRSPRLDVAYGALSGILFGIADLSLGSVAPDAEAPSGWAALTALGRLPLVDPPAPGVLARPHCVLIRPDAALLAGEVLAGEDGAPGEPGAALPLQGRVLDASFRGGVYRLRFAPSQAPDHPLVFDIGTRPGRPLPGAGAHIRLHLDLQGVRVIAEESSQTEPEA